MESWQLLFENSLGEILSKAADEFRSNEFKAIDIGVFPWHSSIEISLLFSSDICELDDVADWPNYDYSQFNEGGWESARDVANVLNRVWESSKDVDMILRKVVETLKQPNVEKQILKLNRASDFIIQVLNPDDSDSSNYYT